MNSPEKQNLCILSKADYQGETVDTPSHLVLSTSSPELLPAQPPPPTPGLPPCYPRCDVITLPPCVLNSPSGNSEAKVTSECTAVGHSLEARNTTNFKCFLRVSGPEKWFYFCDMTEDGPPTRRLAMRK
ncbi:hypothetical protein Bbelb_123940 [Branchiostoma belcheri]|nr:hypothetical protein Bbelb_123940 [Branchiostoma belcheri]